MVEEMISIQEKAMDTMVILSRKYSDIKMRENVCKEMEMLETECEQACRSSQEILDSRDDRKKISAVVIVIVTRTVIVMKTVTKKTRIVMEIDWIYLINIRIT